jgi:hypothetical protein
VAASKLYSWRARYGRVNEHNGWVPRDFWLEEWEKQAIIAFHLRNPLEGYRRLTFMMLDADIVAVSPVSVWRVLSRAGLLRKWNGKPSKKGTGFEQPPAPHQHWHIDVSYIHIAGTFYYLASVLDGFSRFLVHWDLRESMTEADIEIILEAARPEKPWMCMFRHGSKMWSGSEGIARDETLNGWCRGVMTPPGRTFSVMSNAASDRSVRSIPLIDQ